MARTRNIKPGYFKNEDLADLDPLARILFAGLWTLADRDGRLEDRPRRIKAEVLPYDNCQPDDLLQSLADSPGGFILRYEVDGQACIAIPEFTAHQNPHVAEKSANIPAPPEAGTEQAPDKHGASTVQTPDKHDASTVVAGPSSLTLEPSVGNGEPSVGNGEPSVGNGEPSVGNGEPSTSKGFAAQNSLSGKKPDRSADIRAVFDHYRSHHPKAHPRPTSKSKEWRLIRARLKEGYTAEDLQAAIDGCHRSPYHGGENEGGKLFQTLELIVRDGSHVSQFIEMPEGAAVVSEKERRGLRAAQNFLERTE